MISIKGEPLIRVGLMTSNEPVIITLSHRFHLPSGQSLEGGEYNIDRQGAGFRISGSNTAIESAAINLIPDDPVDGCFSIAGITIGIEFHWQRREVQSFKGALCILATEGGLRVINEIPVESYLASVISSEMSATCPPELLRAHAIVSRSWLLSQLAAAGHPSFPPSAGTSSETTAPTGKALNDELIRWYGREAHTTFDVCADDHCQRYQGITKAFSQSVFDAVKETRGKILAFGSEICDARYSKCCGGMTERYSAAWDEKEVPYLSPVYDGPAAAPTEFRFPLDDEANALAWIKAAPPAFCNTRSRELLVKILPGFDQETTDFYRWQMVYEADELTEILKGRLGVDFGEIRELTAVERGASGRIIKLKITGESRTLVIGKELEIRRALSRSHLYSSAFVVDREGRPGQHRFKLTGAGWGHGVGLCQIGAAVMAGRGYSHQDILSHYFKEASVLTAY